MCPQGSHNAGTWLMRIHDCLHEFLPTSALYVLMQAQMVRGIKNTAVLPRRTDVRFSGLFQLLYTSALPGQAADGKPKFSECALWPSLHRLDGCTAMLQAAQTMTCCSPLRHDGFRATAAYNGYCARMVASCSEVSTSECSHWYH
jgi:hypothetical protein